MRNEKGQLTKGSHPWNKGKTGIYSEEILKKISEAGKGRVGYWNGRKRSEETRKKISDSQKGKKRKPLSEKHKKKLSESKKGAKNHFFGKHLSEEHKKKISRKGEKHYNWQGGKSFKPYTSDWTETLRRSIRERDNYICKLCGKTQIEELEEKGYKMTVHHIDYDKKNNNPNNLISLCHSCHLKTNFNRDYWTNYFKGINI